jgi:hypothetical protein
MTPIDGCATECIWNCGRGRTRMCCQMQRNGDEQFQLEILRNNRIYGSYCFADRADALTFADRLRYSLEGNGWIAA